jgi:thymidine kinase
MDRQSGIHPRPPFTPGLHPKGPKTSLKMRLVNRVIRESYDVVGIDEGQFYDDIDVFCDELANAGLKVYCSALHATYLRTPFGNVHKLIAKSDDVMFMKAVDRKTGRDASFTKRIVNNTDEVMIGGGDVYKAVDRISYFRKRITKDRNECRDHPM